MIQTKFLHSQNYFIHIPNWYMDKIIIPYTATRLVLQQFVFRENSNSIILGQNLMNSTLDLNSN